MEDYKNYLIAKGYSKATRAGMIGVAQKFSAWISQQGIDITTLHYNDITAYIKNTQQRHLKTRTVELMTIQVKHYLNYLVESGVLTHNPALALKIKNAQRKKVYHILSPEELQAIYKTYPVELTATSKGPPQTLNKLARKRNKVLLGLFIYQGIATDDVKKMELNHLELREGRITIPGTKRSNERTLKLESHQLFELYDYVNDIRKHILQLTNKQSNHLFMSIGKSNSMQNMMQKLTDDIRQQNPHLTDLHQIRASVITGWLKHYNKRQVQYMAGHRYVSSTEAYEASNIDQLQEDIQKYYPQL